MEKKKKNYHAPQVTVTWVVLESRILAQCSPINHEGIRVNEWEDGETQAPNDGDIHLNF